MYALRAFPVSAHLLSADAYYTPHSIIQPFYATQEQSAALLLEERNRPRQRDIK
jgi:hypothetical protein